MTEVVDKEMLKRRVASMLRFPNDSSNPVGNALDSPANPVRRLYDTLVEKNLGIFIRGLGTDAVARLREECTGIEKECIAHDLWTKAAKSRYVQKRG